ncbi:MAG: transcriptional regulator GcvA [Pseudomonadota bacterium]
MRDIPPVNAVRAFEAASRHMQFQAAAEELGVTPAALSYQIKQLEDHLGIRLFNRLNRAVELTPEGRMISPGIIDAFSKLEETFSLLQGDEENNTLIISTGPAFSAKWLAPRLHSYLEENPNLDFLLSANLKLTDFSKENVDAVIRFGTGNYPGLFVEPLFQEISLPLISPRLYESAGKTADESLFEHVSLIHDGSLQFMEMSQWETWLSAMQYQSVDPRRGARFNHADHCIEAAVDGGGIVMARLGFAFREINAGRLIAPFKEAISAKGGFYFCCPEKNLENEKVLHFLAWLRDEASDQADAIQEFMKDKILLEG